jgi:hypothetical protein
MDRREMLGVLGATAVGLVMTGGKAFGQEEKGSQKHGSEHQALASKCAKTCSDGANECNEGFHHCYEQLVAGKKEYGKAVHACVDCAEMCACSAGLCGRASPLMVHCCDACAKCCDDCIAECEKLNDPELKGVIEACRKTAKECREMAKMMSGK